MNNAMTGDFNADIRCSSKAETLYKLRSEHPEISVPPLLFFTVTQWRSSSASILADIDKSLGETLVVRSSALTEDTHASSNAGAFLSILGVKKKTPGSLKKAIEQVIQSMPGGDEDQLLVQNQVENIEVSGVVFTRCMEDGAPYYVLNYDDESGTTDKVTSGIGVSKTVHIFRTTDDCDFRSDRIRKIIDLARKLETIFSSDSLDIEFGLDNEGQMHLFQVRPIVLSQRWNSQAERLIERNFGYIEKFFCLHMAVKPGVSGRRALFGIMPDWNPAEMIGVMPRPLAVSLYRELITRESWRLAREKMGYRPAFGELMVVAAGRPYIDVRQSFNSFLPVGLPEETCVKIVDAWTDRLCQHPELHDKIEFSVAATCLDFNFRETWAERYPGLLDAEELNTYEDALRSLTLNCLVLGGSLESAERDIKQLENLQQSRYACGMGDIEPLLRLQYLFNETIRYGTIPFAVQARHAFIAEALLRSAATRGVLDDLSLSALRGSVHTIVDSMTTDLAEAGRDEKLRPVFLAKYGHLRPSSYDILSPRYADRPDIFDISVSTRTTAVNKAINMTSSVRSGLNALLKESSMDSISPDGLLAYARRAIAGREYAKFIFTRNLSEIIEIIADLGVAYGFDRDDMSYLDIRNILETSVTSLLKTISKHLSQNIEANRKLFDLTKTLRLPYLITAPCDVRIVPQHRSAPNFIGYQTVSARVLHLSTVGGADLTNSLVCIENADPGFDWIFSRDIAGLITKFGGVNSHMAVRCAEYGLPAAIGCGEKLFVEIINSAIAELNPTEKILRSLDL